MKMCSCPRSTQGNGHPTLPRVIALNGSHHALFRKDAPREFFSAIQSRDYSMESKPRHYKAPSPAHLSIARNGFSYRYAEGLKVANSVGVTSILMMNDPDEARRLAMHNPSAGIVSLHELPDFLRLVAAENAMIKK